MRNDIKKLLAASSSIFLVFLFSVVVFWMFSKYFYWLSDKAQGRQYSAIVLLAGGVTERVPVTVQKYRTGAARLVLLTNDGVLSRWSPKHQRNLYNIEWTQEMLTRSGVPATSIIKLPYAASGTVHDARAVRAYLQSHPVNSLLLVTSDYHANRALWVFKRVLHDMPVRIDVAASESGWSSVVPILLEPLKQVYYRIRFGWFGLPV